MRTLTSMSLLLLLGIGCACGATETDLAGYVDPFIGTDGPGHTYPAAARPFGMVQAGPDTGTGAWDYCSGYQYRDTSVYGYSQTHLNGTGCPDLGDIQILPFSGEVGKLPMKRAIDKQSERASPGRYEVRQPDDGVKVEIAAAKRAAIYRFTWEKGREAKVLVNLPFGIKEPWTEFRVTGSDVKLSEDCIIRGEIRKNGWIKDRKVAFELEFDRKWVRIEDLPREEGRDAPRYVISFDLEESQSVMMKVALSLTSTVDAKTNLAVDIPDWDIECVGNAARMEWNALFARSISEGTEVQKRNWYTALYHFYLQPNDYADAGKKPFYSTFSCWDTFRAAGPLYTILSPEKASEFVDSMLEQGRRTGYLPIWTLWGADNQCMIGTHSVPMIVDAWLKGVWPASACRGDRDGTVESAYQQIKETLTKKHEGRIKENWDLYDQYGYYPFDKIRGESVSRTMECAYDDWCAGVMARKLGHAEDSAFFFKRSAYWKNVFDPSIGVVRGRDTKGKWREPFDPYALGHGADIANDFTEGNAFQYSWHVMQDPQGLIAAMGGRDSFVRKLDALFSASEKVVGDGSTVDVTGLIGQYVHGNEPSHHVIYFYPQVGEPDKAAERIREVFDKFYLPKPDGLCGNDDCGQMSAWCLFSAMGFYPFNPCGGEYVIGAPQIPKVTLNLAKDKVFTMTAKNLSKENKYVESLTLNGKPITDWKIRHSDIMNGGELVFEMVAK